MLQRELPDGGGWGWESHWTDIPGDISLSSCFSSQLISLSAGTQLKSLVPADSMRFRAHRFLLPKAP